MLGGVFEGRAILKGVNEDGQEQYYLWQIKSDISPIAMDLESLNSIDVKLTGGRKETWAKTLFNNFSEQLKPKC